MSKTARCYTIKCGFTGELSKGDTIQLKFIGRLWNSTLADDYSLVERVLIASTAIITLHGTDDESFLPESNVRSFYSLTII